ncbi:PREDICTED: keratin-associated protein 5-2 [Gavialis gangeticus]|uniref:keratin-associated protein 5-2 n=1 Tax=Gavialis gangeticus TaxID=94835 RepID=UPI00092F56BC|nr:PREDICTED: keratin-associated protein 5-2 [Gavialis gangeticus]
MICSSGRESYFNLNSTWYDPSGSWLENHRIPLRYADDSCCGGCDPDVRGVGGHNYRPCWYRRSVCSEAERGSSSGYCGGEDSVCARRPTLGYSEECDGYRRPDRCNGECSSHEFGRRPTYHYAADVYLANERLACSDGCHGSSGGFCGSSGGCHRRRRCGEPCHGSGSYGFSRGCHGRCRSVCGEPCHDSGSSSHLLPVCVKPEPCIPRCPPRQKYVRSTQSCCVPVQTYCAPVQACCPPIQAYCPPVGKYSSGGQQCKQTSKLPTLKAK